MAEPRELPPGTKLHLCGLGVISGRRPSEEAMQEIHAFAYHLRDHALSEPPVAGCRFCNNSNLRCNGCGVPWKNIAATGKHANGCTAETSE